MHFTIAVNISGYEAAPAQRKLTRITPFALIPQYNFFTVFTLVRPAVPVYSDTMKNRVTRIGTLRFATGLLLTIVSLTAASCPESIESIANEALTNSGKGKTHITNEEAITALRDALIEGTIQASDTLSVKDGYYGRDILKILLPPEAAPMIDSITKIPQGQKLVNDVILRLNRAAEESAKDVVPIFRDAITSMTIQDGIAIVKGGNRAATEYLEKKTRKKLHSLYKPKINTALSKPLVAGISAKKSWNTLSTAYNKAGTIANTAAHLAGEEAPMPPVTVDLAEYATGRGLDGLFYMIAEEETKIRKDPLKYTSKMIQKVFGALKEGLL